MALLFCGRWTDANPLSLLQTLSVFGGKKDETFKLLICPVPLQGEQRGTGLNHFPLMDASIDNAPADRSTNQACPFNFFLSGEDAVLLLLDLLFTPTVL